MSPQHRANRRLLVASEVADLLREHIETVRTKTRKGQIPGAINIGTAKRPTWRYDAAALDRWLDSRRTQ